MPDLNFRLSLATLIPDFIYQFLSNDKIDNEIFTCFELEDIRNSISNIPVSDLININKFLMIDNNEKNDENSSENIMNNLDYELEEIDDEYYHRYTPGELKYIFEEIIKNIEIIYDAHKKAIQTNLILTIGFKFKNGLESNMAVEFLNINDTPEQLEDVFFLPMENYFISDDIIARVYFNIDKNKYILYESIFNEIFDIINLKQNENKNTLN